MNILQWNIESFIFICMGNKCIGLIGVNVMKNMRKFRGPEEGFFLVKMSRLGFFAYQIIK